MGHTKIKNNLLYILISNLTWCPVFYFVKSGNSEKKVIRMLILFSWVWNRKLKFIITKIMIVKVVNYSFPFSFFFLFSSSSSFIHPPLLRNSSNSSSINTNTSNGGISGNNTTNINNASLCITLSHASS